MEAIPENTERKEASPENKKTNKKESPQSKLNHILLKHSEPIWKRALVEIFCFYNKLQKQTKGEYSFENLKEKMNHMSLGEWMKFCNDFELTPEKPKSDLDSQKEYTRKFLTGLFKKEAKGNLGINFSSFEVVVF